MGNFLLSRYQKIFFQVYVIASVYVLLNPKPDKTVQQGDIIYVLLPAAIDNNLKFKMDEEVMMADVV